MTLTLGIDPASATSALCFTLPLSCAPLTNVYARMHWSKRAKLKQQAVMRMMAQGVERRKKPLEGKPVVYVTRFSSHAPDHDSGYGAKIVLDCLKADKQGLGYIRDDSPDAIDLAFDWRFAKPGKGAVVVQVFEAGSIGEVKAFLEGLRRGTV